MNMAFLIVLAKLCDSLPTILKNLYFCEVSCSVDINYRWGSEVFLKSLAKSFYRFIIGFLITLYSVTFIPVNHSASLCDGVSVLGCSQEFLHGIISFEVSLYSHLVAISLEAFT